ncbi:MAG: hypothetical protein ABH879_03625 [archaeon]
MRFDLYDGWAPRKHYDVLDLKCGEGFDRLCDVCEQFPEWQMLGIDTRLKSTAVLTTIDLISSDPLTVLPYLAESSADTAYADYYLCGLSDQDAETAGNLLAEKLASGAKLYVGCRKGDLDRVTPFIDRQYFVTDDTYPMRADDIRLCTQASKDLELMRLFKEIDAGNPQRLPPLSDHDVHRFTAHPNDLQPMRMAARRR